MLRFRSLLLILVLLTTCAAPAFAALRGQPLVQRYPAVSLPVGPNYEAIAIDGHGTLFVGGDEGLMAFRSGAWEAVALPRNPSAINTLLRASDGRLYVGGHHLLGELRTADDGTTRYVDLTTRFAKGSVPDNFVVANAAQTTRGVYFRADSGLYFLGFDGSAGFWALPEQASEVPQAVGDRLYLRVLGRGLCLVENGKLTVVPGGEVFATRTVQLMQARGSGLLIGAGDGFYYGDATGVHKLPSDGDAAYAAHQPYAASLRLPDGSLVNGTLDGTLLRFSPDLHLLDRIDLGAGGVIAMVRDREGQIWVASEQEVERLALPSPWSAYTLRQTNGDRIFDSAWYDGTLWLGTTSDVVRADPPKPGAAATFTAQHWTQELEVWAMQASDAGLLVGWHRGLLVLDPDAKTPRNLLNVAITRLLRSSFDPHRIYAFGNEQAFVLAEKDGRWNIATRWELRGADPSGIYETAAGELWFGDARGGAERWRFDANDALVARRRFGTTDGLRMDPAAGTHLFHLDGRLYAISGDSVERLEGERFVAAGLPDLPGLGQPMELESVDTALGTFAWTQHQIWERPAHAGSFRPQQLSASLAPGYRAAKLQEDGQLRLSTWDNLLQFDPGMESVLPPLHANLDQVEVHAPDRKPQLLPLTPTHPPTLPPGSGLDLLFGTDAMESGVEYRFRMIGYTDDWSEWSDDRVLDYRKLPPGDFTLELQARTHSGRSAAMLRYPLSVEPFWYQRTWMRVLFAIAGLLAVAALANAIARLRYRHVIAQNRELEQKVHERTAALEEANSKLADLASRDGLTGVANRRAMELALAREWERCRELGQPLAVVMTDVDHFKQFNDLHGHLAGDEQLRRVAQALAGEVSPPHEMAARYGGEEFALILPGLSARAAAVRAENVRQRVERVTREGGLPGTASLGVAALVPSVAMELSDLLGRADAALYRAKHNGRNRVEVDGDGSGGTKG